MELQEFFQKYPKVALAFSGGVDSAYLLYAAKKAGAEVHAYYVNTQFQPAFELADAKKMAEDLNLSMKVIDVDILQNPDVKKNPKNRCYYCKKSIFSVIMEEAKKDGCDLVIDGTNASDDVTDRPGMQALLELGVRSPLRECGLTKPEIRMLSKEAGLFTYQKPAYACLATRIPTDCEIREEDLNKTETSEGYLSNLGFQDFRVRMVGDMAKLQIRPEDMERFVKYRESILEQLSKDYREVVLDLKFR